MVSRMGAEEVILVRDRRDKRLHIFLNSCRHKGMKVCRYDDGNTLVFTCPFHGWSYDTDGRLVGVPYYDAAYRKELDKSKWGLHEVAQICNYYGSIWATWDPKAPSFEDYVGSWDTSIQHCFQGTDGVDNGVELFSPVMKWRIPTNWKFPGFSFAGDAAHGAMTHRSINVAGIGPQGYRDGGNRAPIAAPFPSTYYSVGIISWVMAGRTVSTTRPAPALTATRGRPCLGLTSTTTRRTRKNRRGMQGSTYLPAAMAAAISASSPTSSWTIGASCCGSPTDLVSPRVGGCSRWIRTRPSWCRTLNAGT